MSIVKSDNHRVVACYAMGIVFVLALVMRLVGLTQTMTHIDDIGPLELLVQSASGVDAGDRISANWTYAPWQFALTYFFYHGTQSWQDLLFAGRFPSALLSSLGIALFSGFLFWQARTAFHKGCAVVVTVIALCSLRSLLESHQSYTYAVIVLIGALFFWAFTALYALQFYNRFLLVLALALLPYELSKLVLLSYQAAYFLPAFLITVTFFVCTQPRFMVWNLGALAVGSGLAVHTVRGVQRELILPLLERGLGGIGWTGEGFAQLREGASFWAGVSWYGKQVIHKIQDSFFYGLANVWPSLYHTSTVHVIQVAVIVVVLGACAFLVYLFRQGAPYSPPFYHTIFSILFYATCLMLCYAAPIPFGSTRHSHVSFVCALYLLYFFMSQSLGILQGLCDDFWKKIVFRLLLAASAVWFLNWVVYAPAFYERTQNNMNYQKVFDIAKQYKAYRIVEFGATHDFRLMQLANVLNMPANLNTEPLSLYDAVKEMLASKNIGSVLVVSHRSPFLKDVEEAIAVADRKKISIITEERREPLGSTELRGILNGGNGFLLIRIQRQDL